MTHITRLLKNASHQSENAQPAVQSQRPPAPGGFGTERIAAFSDGVFAIAITLLILDLPVPGPEVLHGDPGTELNPYLLNLWPKYLTYVLSFVIVGIYWVGHHNTFFYIKRCDRILLWLNILFLLFIVFIPFPTALLGQYWYLQLPAIFYASTLIATGLSIQLLWWYATHNHRLVAKDIDPNLVRRARRRNLTGPVICLAAIAVSFLNVYISLFFFILVPIFYISPGRIDQHWMQNLHREIENLENKEH